jgi:hypothetical protein
VGQLSQASPTPPHIGTASLVQINAASTSTATGSRLMPTTTVIADR